MQKENDTLLVAKLREGNKFAFEALYEKYSARLYNTIVLLVYDKSLAKAEENHMDGGPSADWGVKTLDFQIFAMQFEVNGNAVFIE